jgi:expansin (peptidoglycan-binding protein)
VEKKQSGTEIKATAPGRTTLQGGATAGPASALKKVQGIKGITNGYVF